MSNAYFKFKEFTIHQDRCAMKVTTDGCLFGAWVATEIKGNKGIDIGTGTGLLSLMALQKNSSINIDAIEIDKDAAEQAKENIDASLWKNNITVINEDIRTWTNKYDFIISNPPFYENELRSPANTKNIAHHGDELSLNELFESINKLLVEDGAFFLLLPYKRKQEIESLLKANGLHIHNMVSVKQSTKHPFFRILLKGEKKESSNPINSELSICDDQMKYTSEFISLLKDYYLYL